MFVVPRLTRPDVGKAPNRLKAELQTGQCQGGPQMSKMHFDGVIFWGSIGTVSFRLSNSIFCRAGIVAFVCLVFAGISRGGEGARNIEVVPLHGTSMDTNFNQSSTEDSQAFKNWSPHAPNSFKAQVPPGQTMSMPHPQPTVNSEHEKELMDRRRNWVFMTPEEYASPDGKDGSDDKDGNKKSTTAMERYFQRMNNSEQAGLTNSFNSARLNGRTNLMEGGEVRQPDQGVFAEVPFNPAPGVQVFQPARRNDFADVFGSDTQGTLRTPETIQAEAEQKAHMESFKQIWNIDQPPAAALPVVSTVSAPTDSGPLFGFSTPGIQASTPENPFNHASSSQQPAPQPTVITPRMSRPPHSDFAAPQRPF
jgi:hypothetical protein